MNLADDLLKLLEAARHPLVLCPRADSGDTERVINAPRGLFLTSLVSRVTIAASHTRRLTACHGTDA
jgi:hypothetical protein